MSVIDDLIHEGPAPIDGGFATELEAMGDPRGQILRMTIMEGLSHSDVADRLDLPLGTVKSHARRGLIHLRSMLKEVRDDD